MPRHGFTDEEVGAIKNRILREAAAIVGKTGLGGLSMRILGDAVDLTPGALYRYFPSKKDLLWAMWDNAITELRIAFDTFRNEPQPLEAVRGMLRAYADFALADRDRFRALFLENNPETSDVLTRDPNALAPYEALRGAVALACARGLLRKSDSDRASHMLWASVHGVLTLAVTVPEIDFGDVNTLVDETITTVLHGLKA